MGFRELVGLTQGTSSRTFGEPFTWRTSAGVDIATTPAGMPLQGIFRDAFVGVDVEREIEIGSVAPTLDVRLSDLPEEPFDGARVTIRGKLYRVREEQPDGEGMTKLLLGEAST